MLSRFVKKIRVRLKRRNRHANSFKERVVWFSLEMKTEGSDQAVVSDFRNFET